MDAFEEPPGFEVNEVFVAAFAGTVLIGGVICAIVLPSLLR
jgi:hypothetical protein